MKAVPPHDLRIVAVAALALSVAACDERGPTYPVSPKTMAPSAQVEAFLPALLEEQERVLPALEDQRTAKELDARLDRLTVHLQRRDAQRAAKEIDLSRAALRYYGPSVEVRTADGAELGALDVLLDQAAALVGLPPLTNRASSGT